MERAWQGPRALHFHDQRHGIEHDRPPIRRLTTPSRRLHADLANTRKHAVNTFTTDIARTHATVMVEEPDAAGFFPSSKSCHPCGNLQDTGWAGLWVRDGCGVAHQRDDNAAINLARRPSGQSSDLSGVAAPVGRGAEHETGPRPAAGEGTRKQGPATAWLNNSVRSAARAGPTDAHSVATVDALDEHVT